jgi:hypothetical protein
MPQELLYKHKELKIESETSEIWSKTFYDRHTKHTKHTQSLNATVSFLSE